MFSRWSKSSHEEKDEEVQRSKEIKKKLITELSWAVRELQRAHIGTDIEVERNDENAFLICTLLEAVFLHGYQSQMFKIPKIYNLLGKISTDSIPTQSFWIFLTYFTHKDVLNQLVHLTHISTEVGRCRAWIRLALNEGLTESYIESMLSDRKKLEQFYQPSAFMLDQELPEIMKTFLQGLGEFHFDFNYNSTSLNSWTADALTLSGIWQLPQVAVLHTEFRQQQRDSYTHIPVAVPESVSYPRVTPHPVGSPGDATRSSPHTPGSVTNELEVAELARSIEESFEEQSFKPECKTDDCPSDKLDNVKLESPDKKEVQVQKHLTENVSSAVAPLESTTLTSSIITSPPLSPAPVLGSNRLGASSGWSSSFSPEPTDTTNSGHQNENKSPPEIDPKALKSPHRVKSFKSMLSDYNVQGPKSFGAPVYEESETEFSSNEIPFSNSKENSQILSDVTNVPGFEVVPQSSSVHSEQADDRTQRLMSIITEIANEQGLDHQNYQCKGCGRNIGMIYGEFSVCAYDACYYCYECHTGDEHAIPARIIYNWDLRKHRVAKFTKLFLLKIEEEPLFNIDETNPTLYNAVKELKNVKLLRIQLQHLKGYLFTCKDPIADDVRRRIWPREYLWDDIHQYSLLDLVQVQSGQLAHHLKKIVSHCTKHVYKCKLCCQKGFICEICNDPKIIYPFEVKTTSQCKPCRAVFHKGCLLDRLCPRCVRRKKRHAAVPVEKSSLEFGAPW